MTTVSTDIKNCLLELENGGVILYPTDTIWGLGCDATNKYAIAKIFEIKKRSPSKSMIILVDSMEMIKEYVQNPSAALMDYLKTATSPTTAIFSNSKNLPDNLVHSDGSIAIRIASDDFCPKLIRQFGKPIVSTSANISNQPSPQNFAEIDPLLFSKVDYTALYRRDDVSKKNPSHIIRLNKSGDLERVR